MIASTCIVCPAGAEISAFVHAVENRRAGVHHHHIARCRRCGEAWFEDRVVGAFGVLTARRDTEPCTCPERFRRLGVMFTERPASDCGCGAACLTERLAA